MKIVVVLASAAAVSAIVSLAILSAGAASTASAGPGTDQAILRELKKITAGVGRNAKDESVVDELQDIDSRLKKLDLLLTRICVHTLPAGHSITAPQACHPGDS